MIDSELEDLVRSIEAMRQIEPISVRKIADWIGRDDSWVKMMLKMDSMSPEIKNILAPKVKDARTIYHVATVDGPGYQKAIARYNLRRKDVEEIKKKLKRKA